ncbi:MAG: tetratricopeptide repeat protein [Cyanobacteria bacterium P01_G01_bin.54]
MLQWFKKISQRPRLTKGQQTGGEAAETGSEPSSATQPLNDRDYEFLFTQLLEGVSHGWQPVRIQRFFAALEERSTIEQWIEWLQRYGAKILTSSAPNTTLARRMVALGELTQELPVLQQLGETASGIGRLLLARSRPGDADTWQYEPVPTPQPEPSLSPPSGTAPDSTLPTPDPAAALVTSSGRADLNSPIPSSEAVPLSLTLPSSSSDGQQTITLDELLVRLQEDEALVTQVAQRLGLETQDPQVIIQELVRQLNQRQGEVAPASSVPDSSSPDSGTVEISAPASPVASGAAGSEAESAFNLGVQQYETGDYAGAIAFWEQAIDLKPDYYQAWGNRGLGLKNLKRFDDALASYEKALQIAPDFYKAWYNRGLVLDELQRHAEAIVAYDKVLELRADFHKAWYSRGLSLEQLGDTTNAITAYDQAIQLKPDFQKAWLNRAHCHRRLAQPDAALADYDQAIALKPDDIESLQHRGALLCQLQRYPAAVESYTQAIRLKPDDVQLLQARGDALAQAQQWAEALDDYEQVLAQQPDATLIWLAKGQVLQRLGWEERAKHAYQAAQEQMDQHLNEPPNETPTDAAQSLLWQWQGRLCYQQRAYGDALDYCDRILQQHNDHAAVWGDRGRTLLALGRVEEAIASFDRSLQLEPLTATVWGERASAAAQSEQADLLLSALSLPAQQEPTLNQRGFAGQTATLKTALNRLEHQHYPVAWAQLQQRLGDAYYQAGFGQTVDQINVEQLQQALSHYQQAQSALTPQTAPQTYLALLGSQMRTELAIEEPQAALATHQKAQQFFEALLSMPATPLTEKRAGALQMAVLHQLRVDLGLQLGELLAALEWAEYSRNFSLAWLWERLPLQEGSPKWPAIQRRLDEQTAIVYWHLSPLALTTFLVTRQAPEPTVLGRVPNVVLNVVLSPALRARVESAKQNSEASLELLLELLGLDNTNDNNVLAAMPTATEPPPEPAAEADVQQRRQDLETWLVQWQDLQQDSELFRSQLPEQLEQLRQLLQIEAIVTALQTKGINNLILIPHQGLHDTPVQVLFPDPFTVTSLPSLRLAQPSTFNATSRSAAEDPWLKPTAVVEDEEDWLSLGLGETPTPPTPQRRSLLCWPNVQPEHPDRWALQLITQEMGKSTAPPLATKTVEDLTQALGTDAAYIHWQPTITANPTCPQQSQLQPPQLQTVDPQRLAVSDLGTIALNHCELWSLEMPEACSLRYPEKTPEILTVSTVLLSQGITYVLRPLWRVESPAHLLFMVEFYHRLAQGSSAIVAHKQAQIWLRTITIGELLKWYQARIQQMEPHPDCATQLGALVQAIQDDPIQALNPEDKPYAHPYYWAGYVIVGYPL